jgi:hypothetical protein
VQPTPSQQNRHDQTPQPVTFIQQDIAARLLLDFLTACKTEEGVQRDTFTRYAQQRAEHQLDAWGVER